MKMAVAVAAVGVAVVAVVVAAVVAVVVAVVVAAVVGVVWRAELWRMVQRFGCLTSPLRLTRMRIVARYWRRYGQLMFARS
jgi:O-antigen/teichoic acid export membrane protein